MFCKVSKKKILELLIENQKCVSKKLIYKVFEYICNQEDILIEFNDNWRKKIKSTLTSLDVSWKKTRNRRDLQMKFLKKCSEQYLEFNLKLLNAQKEDFMDYVKESDSLDFLLKKMKISK